MAEDDSTFWWPPSQLLNFFSRLSGPRARTKTDKNASEKVESVARRRHPGMRLPTQLFWTRFCPFLIRAWGPVSLEKKLSRATRGTAHLTPFVQMPDSTFSQGSPAPRPELKRAKSTSKKVESAGTLECPLGIPGFKILSPIRPPEAPTQFIVEESTGGKGGWPRGRGGCWVARV